MVLIDKQDKAYELPSCLLVLVQPVLAFLLSPCQPLLQLPLQLLLLQLHQPL